MFQNKLKINSTSEKSVWIRYPWFELEQVPQLAHAKVIIRMRESNKLGNPRLKVPSQPNLSLGPIWIDLSELIY